MGLTLNDWTNSYDVEDYKKFGHKIKAVSKSGGGHIVTYEHKTLTKKPKKGDLVEYYHWNGNKDVLKRAIVQGTEEDSYCIQNCIDLKNSITPLHDVKRIVKRALIKEKLFKYF